MTFVKGQSGNPAGRPPSKVSVVQRLKERLIEHPEEVDQIVVSLIKQAKLGNMIAAKEILDRIDGRVVERHKLEGELPITLQFVPASALLASSSVSVEEIEATSFEVLPTSVEEVLADKHQ